MSGMILARRGRYLRKPKEEGSENGGGKKIGVASRPFLSLSP